MEMGDDMKRRRYAERVRGGDACARAGPAGTGAIKTFCCEFNS